VATAAPGGVWGDGGSFFNVEVTYPEVARPNRQRPTLADVAAELGVSAKTVSNAYRHPDQLSPRLRGRVLAAAARIGFAGPDPVAAGLRRGRVGAVGFAYANRLSYAFEDPVAVELLGAIASVAEEAGAGLALLPGSATRRSRVQALAGALIDGLIVNSLAADDPLLAAAIGRRLPLVVIDQPDPERMVALGGSDSPWIGIDDRAAAAALAEHVLSLGHRRLAVVSFALHRRPVRELVDERAQADATYAVTRRRLAGYRDAVQRAGLDWSRVPVIQGADSTVAEGEAGAAAALAATPRPTALICLSDRLAEGALRAAARLGLSVPRDVSIAGFDDAPSAAGLDLTTVRQPHRRKGSLAAAALLAMLDGAPADAPRTLPTELVVRGSTGAPNRREARLRRGARRPTG
jgi:DNA-binding LacI/PurR family transcriptional regulator